MTVTLLATYLIYVVVVMAIIGVVLAVAKHSGVAIPPIVYTVFWIVFGAVLAILAIRFLVGLL